MELGSKLGGEHDPAVNLSIEFGQLFGRDPVFGVNGACCFCQLAELREYLLGPSRARGVFFGHAAEWRASR